MSYGDLRGRVVARLIGLFKIRNILSETGGVRHQILLHVLNPINPGRFRLLSGDIPVGKQTSG